MISSGEGSAEFGIAPALADAPYRRMRSAAIALWSMVDPPFFRAAAFSADIGVPAQRPAAIPEQPRADPAIRRGGFGLLGDRSVADELGRVAGESGLCAA
jgi:hypothetical protein